MLQQLNLYLKISTFYRFENSKIYFKYLKLNTKVVFNVIIPQYYCAATD